MRGRRKEGGRRREKRRWGVRGREEIVRESFVFLFVWGSVVRGRELELEDWV